jgi:hypothetical protein
MNHLVDEFKREQGIDLSADKAAVQRLKEAAEKAKIELSTTNESEINLPFITADASGPKHFTYTLTRAKLEQLVGDLVAAPPAPARPPSRTPASQGLRHQRNRPRRRYDPHARRPGQGRRALRQEAAPGRQPRRSCGRRRRRSGWCAGR